MLAELGCGLAAFDAEGGIGGRSVVVVGVVPVGARLATLEAESLVVFSSVGGALGASVGVTFGVAATRFGVPSSAVANAGRASVETWPFTLRAPSHATLVRHSMLVRHAYNNCATRGCFDFMSYWMTTVFLTVTRSPVNGGTVALRIVDAIQPPVAVPANGGPSTNAWVDLPLFVNVTVTRAMPEGSPGWRHEDALLAAKASALAAAVESNGPGVAGVASALVAGPA